MRPEQLAVRQSKDVFITGGRDRDDRRLVPAFRTYQTLAFRRYALNPMRSTFDENSDPRSS